MKSINSINQLNKSDFLSIFGNIFEKTEWIAEKVFDLKPFKSNDDLFSKMINQYENCDKEQILIILNSHPELAVEKKLTKDSSNEQSGASLNECTFEEFEEFKKLNIEYRTKFGFPFIIAVKGKNKNNILNDFRKRIQNDLNSEFEEAKKQVMKIASFRFNDIASI
jgi:2-oxo-4-hydroxy-4-carboxy-5-ureidoimidazoline decarboxylase